MDESIFNRRTREAGAVLRIGSTSGGNVVNESAYYYCPECGGSALIEGGGAGHRKDEFDLHCTDCEETTTVFRDELEEKR